MPSSRRWFVSATGSVAVTPTSGTRPIGILPAAARRAAAGRPVAAE